jgi:hypothetical protein
MSSSGLTRMSKRMLDRINMANTREKVITDKGQIFIWRRKQFEEAMLQHTSKEIVDELLTEYRKKLTVQDRKMMSLKVHRTRLQNAKKSIIDTHIEKYNPANDEIYAVFNYNSIHNIKREIGVLFNKLSGKDSKLVTGRIDKGQKREDAVGEQVGHGEFGHAVSTTKALAAESVLRSSTSAAKYSSSDSYKKLESALNTYKTKMGVNLGTKHYQEISPLGSLKKNYTAILSSQDAKQNLLDAVDEKAALAELRKSVEEEYKYLLHQEGSDTLYEAIEDHLNYKLASAKNATFKGKRKPKKSSKTSGKGSKSKQATIKSSVQIISGAGAFKSKKRRAPARGIASNPLALIAEFNKRLPNAITSNMESPALNYQTGRFASSVRVTDVQRTRQGFYSFGYTYQKNPYQTFEPGYAQGDSDRDPRKLIDRTMREIAVEFAIGRFYTRRV